MAIQVAFKPGKCAICGGVIEVGRRFAWGAEKGQRIHERCAGVGEAVDVSVREDRVYSDEQRAVIDEVVKGSGSLVVLARAGTGKTYTVEGCCMELPESISARYMVFARKNAAEAKSKLASYYNVEASTFHSAGYQALRQRLGRVNLEDYKVRDLLNALTDKGAVSQVEADALGPDIVRLVHYAKCVGIGAGLKRDCEDSWFELIEHFGLQFDMPEDEEWDAGDSAEERAIEIARQILRLNNDDLSIVDYDDFLYQTVRLHIPLPQFDIVFIDEAQDTSPVRRAMAHMMMKPGVGRLVAVGDNRQAIMTFTGADLDSLDIIRDEFDAKTLPLTINYRCSRSVIAAAQEWVPDIRAHDGAPAGRVQELSSFILQDFTATDAVLCRTNAPLVTLWYRLFKEGIKAQMLGRDLGKGLLALVKKFQGRRKAPITLEMLVDRAEAYKEREVAKWTAKGNEIKAQAAADKVDCLLAVVDALPEAERHMAGLMGFLTDLVSASVDPKEGQSAEDLPPVLTLCSVHRSKGLEWPRVFVLNWSEMPSKRARKEWERMVELNLCYVAVTRAKQELYFIEADGLESQKLRLVEQGVLA